MTVWSMLDTLFSSLLTVNRTLMRRLCGSVQTNPASSNFSLFRPLIFFRQIASKSRLSLSQKTHGGRRNLLQNRQKCSTPSLLIPSVMSTSATVQVGQMLPELGVNLTPHVGHRMVPALLYVGVFSMCYYKRVNRSGNLMTLSTLTLNLSTVVSALATIQFYQLLRLLMGDTPYIGVAINWLP